MASKFEGGNSNCKHELDINKQYKEFEYGCIHCSATIYIYPIPLSKKDQLEVMVSTLKTILSFSGEDKERDQLAQAEQNLKEYLKRDRENDLRDHIKKIEDLSNKHNAHEYYKKHLDKAKKELNLYLASKKLIRS